MGSVDGDYLLSPLGASISAIRSRTRLLGLDDDLHDQSFRGETWHADHDASRDSRADRQITSGHCSLARPLDEHRLCVGITWCRVTV